MVQEERHQARGRACPSRQLLELIGFELRVGWGRGGYGRDKNTHAHGTPKMYQVIGQSTRREEKSGSRLNATGRREGHPYVSSQGGVVLIATRMVAKGEEETAFPIEGNIYVRTTAKCMYEYAVQLTGYAPARSTVHTHSSPNTPNRSPSPRIPIVASDCSSFPCCSWYTSF